MNNNKNVYFVSATGVFLNLLILVYALFSTSLYISISTLPSNVSGMFLAIIFGWFFIFGLAFNGFWLIRHKPKVSALNFLISGSAAIILNLIGIFVGNNNYLTALFNYSIAFLFGSFILIGVAIYILSGKK